MPMTYSVYKDMFNLPELQRERSSSHWSTLQMLAVAGAGPVSSTGSPKGVQGPGHMGRPLLVSQAFGKGVGPKRTRTRLGCQHCGWVISVLPRSHGAECCGVF